MEFLLVLIFWMVLWGIAGGLIGKPKGLEEAGTILGALLGPIGLLIVACAQGNRINCPHCNALTNPRAAVCMHCGRDIIEEPSPTPRIAQPRIMAPRVVTRVSPPSVRYFICSPGATNVSGPYNESQLSALRDANVVNEETLFCQEGTESWANRKRVRIESQQ